MRWIIGILLVASAAPAAAQPLRVAAYQTEAFFYPTEDGAEGLELEILEYYCKANGTELEIVWVESFGDILPMIQRGEADVAAATITITSEREALVDFSASYFPVRVMLVEPKGPQSESLEALAGARLATIPGTTLEALLEGVPGASFEYVESQKDLFAVLAAGRARAMAVDSAVAFTLLPQFPGLQLGVPLSDVQNYGFATTQGSGLASRLSHHISQLKSSGIYYRLLEKYLGEEAVRTVKAASQ